MSTFPRSPKVLKGGFVLLAEDGVTAERIISLQYNPDTLTRTLQVQGAGEEGGERSEALRLTGPPVETWKLEAELDATDRLGNVEQPPPPLEHLSLQRDLAALETLVYPDSADVEHHKQQARQGMLEIAPMEAPLTLFIWGPKRILPVRITELTITEEAFDPELNPIRARVSLGLRILNQNDLGLEHRGTNLFTVYHQYKEELAGKNEGGALSTFGLEEIPL